MAASQFGYVCLDQNLVWQFVWIYRLNFFVSGGLRGLNILEVDVGKWPPFCCTFDLSFPSIFSAKVQCAPQELFTQPAKNWTSNSTHRHSPSFTIWRSWVSNFRYVNFIFTIWRSWVTPISNQTPGYKALLVGMKIYLSTKLCTWARIYVHRYIYKCGNFAHGQKVMYLSTTLCTRVWTLVTGDEMHMYVCTLIHNFVHWHVTAYITKMSRASLITSCPEPILRSWVTTPAL
jgi:hypothetical protein